MIFRLMVFRNLRQHAIAAGVTIFSLALAAALAMTVWVVKVRSQEAFAQTTASYDAVLGARGSKMQLVLNALFHVEASPGNVAWSDFLEIRQHPAVKRAVPLAVGDNFKGWRIVGTLPEIFDGVSPKASLEGRVFKVGALEAVVGSFAAEKLGLRVGSHFHPYHGLDYNPAAEHDEDYVVTGLLAPTNTPMDRVIWIPLEGVQTMSGHDKNLSTEVSAVLVSLRSPMAGMMLDRHYNRDGKTLTFAFPAGAIVAELFSRIGWFDRVLGYVAYLVAVVAACTVVASLYASMSARKRDLAIMRALGARRRRLFALVVAEAALLGFLGGLLGFVLHFGLVALAAALLRSHVGVVIAVAQPHAVWWVCPAAMTLLAALGGVVPAVKAYRMAVAEALTPLS